MSISSFPISGSPIGGLPSGTSSGFSGFSGVSGQGVSSSNYSSVGGSPVTIYPSITRPSTSVIIGPPPIRTDFKVYIWPYDGSSGVQLDTAGFNYYRNLGLNFTRDFYDINAAPINVTNATTGGTNSVDFWAARAEALQIDLWWMDIEGGYYTGTAGDVNIVPDVTAVVPAAKSRWATHFGTTFYIGSYGDVTGIQADDTKSSQVSAQLDFLAPENYLNADIAAFKALADTQAATKTRVGITKPLIPVLLRNSGTLAADVYARLVYLYNKPQINGAIMWGTDTAAAGPTYYDATGWMVGVKQFLATYPIATGHPF